MVIRCLIDRFNLVTSKHECLDCPVAMLNVVDLGFDGRDYAKVMPSAIHGPPQL